MKPEESKREYRLRLREEERRRRQNGEYQSVYDRPEIEVMDKKEQMKKDMFDSPPKIIQDTKQNLFKPFENNF